MTHQNFTIRAAELCDRVAGWFDGTTDSAASLATWCKMDSRTNCGMYRCAQIRAAVLSNRRTWNYFLDKLKTRAFSEKQCVIQLTLSTIRTKVSWANAVKDLGPSWLRTKNRTSFCGVSSDPSSPVKLKEQSNLKKKFNTLWCFFLCSQDPICTFSENYSRFEMWMFDLMEDLFSNPTLNLLLLFWNVF